MADDVEYVKVTSEKLNFALDNPHVLGIIVAIIAVIITLCKYITFILISFHGKIFSPVNICCITSLGRTICMRMLYFFIQFQLFFHYTGEVKVGGMEFYY